MKYDFIGLELRGHRRWGFELWGPRSWSPRNWGGEKRNSCKFWL